MNGLRLCRWQAVLVAALLATFLFPALARAAGGTTVSINATVLSKSVCRFNAATATLAFGDIDPSSPVDATASTTIGFVCRGSAPLATYIITDDDGLYDLVVGAHRMRHTVIATEYLPYAFSYATATATVPKNADQTLTISGTVQQAVFQNAVLGDFADTVVLTISP